MTFFARSVASAGLACLFAVACSSSGNSGTGNSVGAPAPPSGNATPITMGGSCSGASCQCNKTAPCSIDCAITDSCHVDCNSDTQSCVAACNGNCNVDCNSAQTCGVNCGANCTIDCNSEKGACRAAVGPGSTVDCNSAASCAIECGGNCTVDCNSAQSCRVLCDSGVCTVTCANGPPTKCPDGRTLVCPGTPC